ncbi:uncharacterized protein LY79DRAFT_352997 [Colletotrichum navitas]|uniref:Uncharacterized protein n=1 Tax=Colletotrichum navitas TaxID=681940 RepID=A0AAD8V9X4_9PEZI|nr:uncharacterized protein LY79DRAFT_352997 [Colletotrichum navitas]KAK1597678.1 hypothetical protein LY79DRAFT_352997 [Colletotrichum navitas]
MAGKRTGPAHHLPLHSSARLFGTSLMLSLTGVMPSFDRVRNPQNHTAENTAHRPRQDAIGLPPNLGSLGSTGLYSHSLLASYTATKASLPAVARFRPRSSPTPSLDDSFPPSRLRYTCCHAYLLLPCTKPPPLATTIGNTYPQVASLCVATFSRNPDLAYSITVDVPTLLCGVLLGGNMDIGRRRKRLLPAKLGLQDSPQES